MNKVAIVGAGASGLVAAIYAKNSNDDVYILEKNEECGKKILVTGNGRCNYFNDDQDLKHYYSKINLDGLINKKNLDEVEKFFLSIGIVPKIKNGYYYPYSNQASSIKKALENEVKRLNIKIINNFEVINIKKINNEFLIYSNNEVLKFDKVILSTGSKAYPKTGSVGDGYTFAKNFGHNIIDVLLSLTQLRSNKKYFKKLSGIRCDANLKLYENGNFIKEETGELQLTNYGISGICTFNLSGFVSRGLSKGKKEEIIINFIPMLKAKNISDVIDYLDNRNKILKNRKLDDLFIGLLNDKLIYCLLEISDIDKNKYFNDLSDYEKRKLSENLCFFKVNIDETNSFDSAQVCTGGIDLKEVNLNSMESKIVSGLYFSGEILDVDGECGGYNLTFAWVTGMVAGKNV